MIKKFNQLELKGILKNNISIRFCRVFYFNSDIVKPTHKLLEF